MILPVSLTAGTRQGIGRSIELSILRAAATTNGPGNEVELLANKRAFLVYAKSVNAKRAVVQLSEPKAVSRLLSSWRTALLVTPTMFMAYIFASKHFNVLKEGEIAKKGEFYRARQEMNNAFRIGL